MKSLQLRQLFEVIKNDTDLSDNKLFFNNDGTVNKEELYCVLLQYGVTRQMLDAAIDRAAMDTLVTEDGISITNLNVTTVGDVVVEWFSTYIYDNTIVTMENRWHADEPPAGQCEYFNMANKAWMPILDNNKLPHHNTLDHLYPNVYTRGLSCTYGKIDVGIVEYCGNHDGFDQYTTGILSLNPDGSINNVLMKDGYTPLLRPMHDITRYGNRIFTMTSEEQMIFEANVSPLASSFVPDTTFLLDKQPIRSTMSIFGNEIYGAIVDNTSMIEFMKYNILTGEYQTLSRSKTNKHIGTNLLAGGFITPTRVIMFRKGDDSLICHDHDSLSVLWDIPTPKAHKVHKDDRITGISYDPVYNYLYVLSSRTLVRYSID